MNMLEPMYHVYIEDDEFPAVTFDSFKRALDWGKLNAERENWKHWEIRGQGDEIHYRCDTIDEASEEAHPYT